MKRVLLLAYGLVLLQAGLFTCASADTLTYTDSVPLSTTNWSLSVTIPKFDPSLGDLTSVTFKLGAHIESVVKFESLDAAPATVTTSLSGEMHLKRPDLTDILVVLPSSSQSENVAAFDGTIDFGGTSGKTYPQVLADKMETVTSPPPISDLALFTGVGNIILPVTTTAAVVVSGPGNVVQQVNTQASAQVTVIYNYNPPGLYQAYRYIGGGPVIFSGLAQDGERVISALPGVLCIDPGDEKWANYVTAARLQIDYFIKNVVLRKEIPETGQCYDVFSSTANYPGFNQQGTRNIRLWWPLMFELPGTKWTLTAVSGTQSRVQLPGETVPGYVHEDVWEWMVDASVNSMKDVVALFHQLPWGLCEIPLISNETLYTQLQEKLDELAAAVERQQMDAAATALIDFEILVMENCTSQCPVFAAARFQGIVNTQENPVCCKLIADAEYIGKKLGIFENGGPRF